MSSIGPNIYVDVPIETDPQDLLNDAYNYLRTVIPGWTPSAGNVDVWILMAIASLAAESRDVASLVPASIFRWFGANLINLPPQNATSATTLTKWTMINNNGYTIPAGTQVAIPIVGGEPVPFITTSDVVVPNGTTIVDGVEIEAVNAGAAASGLGAINGPVTLLDGLNFVASVTQDAPTSGGIDAEADQDYLDRLTSELALLAPRPITASDFAIYARNTTGVHRATALDGYDPGTNTYNNPREVTIAAVDSSGTAVDAATKNAIQASLDAAREVNFIVNVIDPTLNQIDVTATVKALPGWDATIVRTAVQAALSAYLNPATWGSSNTTSTVPDWVNTTVLRYLLVTQIVLQTAGVAYIESLTIGIHGGPMVASDVILSGPIPLVIANTLTITVDVT